MKSPRIAVLTYHGYNISGNDYHNNDHVALAEDLQWLHTNGWQFVSLEHLADALFDDDNSTLPERAVCLTFDDATDLDWMDVEFPGYGLQRSLHGILADFSARYPESKPHATSFVIASPRARQTMAEYALHPDHGMDERWWQQAESSPLMSIGNHSWDHRHPLVVPEEQGGGSFTCVNTLDQARLQIEQAGRYIAQRIGHRPNCFAYPWGQASDYLRHDYFPRHRGEHGCRIAVSTQPDLAHPGSDRWFLPRFVSGHDWRSPEQLAAILRDC